jgi:hypothetical protein
MAPLKKQPVEIVFRQGLDTKTNPHIVPVGKLRALENYALRDGTLQRRPGSSSVYAPAADDSTSKPGPNAVVATHKGNLLVRDKGRLYPYSESLDRLLPGGLVKEGDAAIPPSSLLVDRQRVAGSNGYLLDCDTAISGELRAVVWTVQNASGYITTYDRSGAVILPPTQFRRNSSEALYPRLLALAGNFAVFYLYNNTPFTAPTSIAARIVDIADNPYVLGEAITIEATDSYTRLDGAVMADGSGVLAAIRVGGSSVRTVRLLKVSSGGTVSASHSLNTYAAALAPPTNLDAVGVTVSADGNVFVVYAVLDGSSHLTLRGSVRTPGLTTAVTAEAEIIDLNDVLTSPVRPKIALSPGPTDGSAYLVVEVWLAGSGSDSLRRILHGVLGADLSWTPSTMVDGAIVTKPFRMGNSEMMFGVESPATLSASFEPERVTPQRSLLIVDHRGFVVARLGPGEVANTGVRLFGSTLLSVRPGHVCIEQDDGRWTALFTSAGRGQASLGERGVISAFTLTEDAVSQAEARRLVPVEYGGSTYFPGAILRQYDGRQIFEAGWNSYVDHYTVATAAGSLAAGDVICAVVPEHMDAAGELHQAAPFLRLLVRSGAGSISWTILDEPYTDRTGITYALYRSEPGGSTLYRLQTTGIAGSTETEGETDISRNAQLYTTGGEFPALPFPACSQLFEHGGRLCMVANDGLYFTNKYIPGFAPRSHPTWVVRSTGRFGKLVAGASLPGRIALLSQRGLEYTTGDGPNEMGVGGAFSEPLEIPSPTGCHNPQSVVSTPVGVFFQGDGGIWLLNQGLGLEYVGAPVEPLTGTITTAVHLPAPIGEVRFAQAEPDLTLVYNYLRGEWATNGRRVAVSATLWRGRITWADHLTTGETQILQEDPDALSDNGIPIASSVETGEFALGGLNGFQRVRWVSLLGTHRGNCLVSLEIAYDREPKFSQRVVRHYSSDENAVTGRPMQIRFKPARQRCRSIRFRITCDGGGDGPSGGVDLTSIGLELGVKPGFKASELRTLNGGG